MKINLSNIPTLDAVELGSFVVGTKALGEMVKGYKNLTKASLAEDQTEKNEYLKEADENHLKGVSLLTISAIISGLKSGDWTYATMQPGFCLTTLKKYYESHTDEFSKLGKFNKKIVNLIIKNWNLHSSIGTNLFLTFISLELSEMNMANFFQIIGAAIASVGLESINKLSGKFKIPKSQILLLAGRISMLVASTIKITDSPTGASAAWFLLMLWASYRNSIDLKNSLKI